MYIFQKDQTLLISQVGEVDKGRWEEVGDNSILIEIGSKSTLYKPTHKTEHLLILKVDGKEEYLHFVDEKLYEEGYKTTDKINELIGVLAESEQKRKNEKDNMVFILIFLGIPLIIFTIIAIIQS